VSNFRWGIVTAILAVFLSVSLGFVSGVNIFHVFVRAVIFGTVFFGLGFGLRFAINSFFPELLSGDNEYLSHETDQAGSRINITVDNVGEYAVPELYKSLDDSHELGNVEDLISGSFRPKADDEYRKSNENQSFAPILEATGIDRIREAGYNDLGGIQDDFQELAIFDKSSAEKPIAEKSAVYQPQFTPSFGDDSGLGGLPDLDMMARAFSSVSGSLPFVPTPAAPVSSAPPAVSSAPSMQSVSSMPLALEVEPDRTRYTGNKPQKMDGDFDAKSLAEGIRTVLSKE